MLYTGIETVTLAGQYLEFTTGGGHVLFRLKIADRFYPASSNSYSLDYVFDPTDMNAYIDGVPAAGTLALRVGVAAGHPDFWLKIDAGGSIDPSKRVEIPALSSYWRPLAE